MRAAAAGLTLLELLLVVLFLAGGIASLLYVDMVSLQNLDTSYRKFMITKGVLEYQLEALRGVPFGDTALAAPSNKPCAVPPNASSIPMLSPTLFTPLCLPLCAFTNPTPPVAAQAVTSCRYTVTDDATKSIKRVTVEVDWTDIQGHPHTDWITTMVTKSGVTN